jgi:hypothetical protein
VHALARREHLVADLLEVGEREARPVDRAVEVTGRKKSRSAS